MSHPANDNFSLHDDASLDGSVPATNKGDAPAKPPQTITTNTLSNIKLPVLQKDDYDTWAGMIMINGNSKKRVTKGKDGVYRVLPPTTQEEQFADEKERKARTLLLMAVPKDQLRLFSHVSPKRLGSNQDIVPKLLSLLDALGAGVSDVYYFSPLHLQIASKLATPGLADEVIPFFSTTNADDVDLIHEDLDKIDDLSGWKNSCAFDKRKVEFNYHNTGHLPGSACLGSKEGSRRKSRDEELNHALMAFTVNKEGIRCRDIIDISYTTDLNKVEFKGGPPSGVVVIITPRERRT
ncbi:hypothetical protein Tco_1502908 [Tanacetum coccineum]